MRAALIAVFCAVGACVHASPTSQIVAFTNATVIDGTGSPPRPGTTIVARDGRIVAVQPAGAPIPAAAITHDLTGKYVIPGLIDAHVHFGTQERPPGMMEAVLRSVFMGGVTAVRDMGGRYETVRPLADKGSSDTVPMPRVVFAAIMSGGGMWLEGERARFFAGDTTPGESPTVRRLATIDDVRPAVAAAKAAGARGIKIYNAIRPELIGAVADEARRQGLAVWSHFYVDPASPSVVLAARPVTVSHGDQWVAELIADSLRRGALAAYRTARHGVYTDRGALDRAEVAALLRTMREQGTILEPTLFIMRAEPDSNGRIDERRGALYTGALEFVRRAHRAGVDIAAGTDAIGGSSPNLHVELQLLVDSVGLTPLEAIRSATSVNARALGIDDAGTIAVGRRADLVVLDADPSHDIANTMTVRSVVKAGRLHSRPQPMRVPPGARAPR